MDCASVPNDQSSFVFVVRVPCSRNMGQNAPYSNQRTNNSRYAGSSGSPMMNPPISVVQYGIPGISKWSPAGIGHERLSQFDSTSPDHAVTELRWIPANAERERMNTRFLSEAARCPSYTPAVVINGYRLV